ncbi:MAG: hypothetical protein WA705_00495 [Candidatus Ozemobacteraceae bacterium]
MRFFIAVMFVVLVAIPAFSQTELSLAYGDAPGKVAFLNSRNNPGVQEPLPWGPMSFRVNGQEFWIADTVAGRIYQLDAKGGVLGTISLPKSGKNAILEDIALVRDPKGVVSSVWVSDGSAQEAVLYSIAGEKLKTIGGRGEMPGKFRQISRIEVGPSGRLYASDKGKQLITVFQPDGRVARELPWQWSGFCLDSKEDLYYLKWDDQKKRLHLRAESVDGKSILDETLELPSHTNPELWFITSAGEAFITFTPDGAPIGTLKLARCTLNGKLVGILDIKLPIVMNRYLEPRGAEGVWLGQVDYGKAPDGAFRIIPFKFSGKPEG